MLTKETIAFLQSVSGTLKTLAASVDRYIVDNSTPTLGRWAVWPVGDMPAEHRIVVHRFGEDRGTYIHEGDDIRAWAGKPILSVASGIIKAVNRWNGTRGSKAGWQNYGTYVVVLNDDGYTCLYGHLMDYKNADGIEIRVGSKINAGDVIGHADSTGNSDASHLHLTVTHPTAPPAYVFNQRAIDPSTLLPVIGKR